jgi:hypothetical protein
VCSVAAIGDCLQDQATAVTCIRDTLTTCAGAVDMSCLETSHACFTDCVGDLRACFQTI